MKKNAKLLASAALILVLSIVTLLTGCAAKSAATTPSASAAATAATGTTATATPAASAKKVVVTVASEEKPLSYTDASGKLTGYEVEALKEVDKLIPEYEFDIQSVDADSQQIGLDAGKYVLIAEGLFKTAERQEKYLLPDENVGASLIKITVKGSDTTIKTLDDLVGKKVAPVSPNGGIFNLLTAYNKAHTGQITITTQEGLSDSEKYQGVASGKYDAVVLPSLGFDEIKKSLNLDIKQTDPVKISYTYFVLGKTQTDLTAKVNEALKSLKSNGTLSNLSVQFFGEDVLKYQETK